MKFIYKTSFALIFNSSFLILNCFSQQAPGIEWQNTIGGNNDDGALSIEQTTDGGYIIGSISNSDISGDKTENCRGEDDYWVIKLNSLGSIQWQKTIGGSDEDELMSIQQTFDGGYILGGSSYSDISGDKTQNSAGTVDFWIVKMDSIGNIQWQNSLGGNKEEYLYSVQQTIDGGYIVGGWSDSNISGDKTENSMGWQDYWVVKLTATGAIQWQNTIGGNYNENLWEIRQTIEGGYILAGLSNSDSSGDKTENTFGTQKENDCWIIKLDSIGTVVWQKSIGGYSSDGATCIEITNDGGYIIGAISHSDSSGNKTENSIGSNDYWVIKLDSLGNIQWQNTIGGNSTDNLFSIHQTPDGGYFLGGWSESDSSGDKSEDNMGNYDYWVIKLDSLGNVIWENSIGGNSLDALGSVGITGDGGYILVGHSYTGISFDKTEASMGDGDIWIVKLGPDTITGIFNHRLAISNLQFFPNPFTTQSKLFFKNTNKERFLFTLYDNFGRVTESVITTHNEVILSKGSKQPGIYLFNLTNTTTMKRSSGKVIITN